jgi:hypothetical protein
MAKNPDERYQTAKDLLVDLKSLRKQLDHGPVVVAEEETDHAPQKKRALMIALVAIVVVAGAFLTFALWRAAQTRSTGAVLPRTGSRVQSTPAPGPERRLTYWITVQEFRDGKHKRPYTMAGEVSFEPKDRVRLNIGAPQTGHLYILNEGPRDGSTVPEYSILFPSSSANNGSPVLARDQHILIPEEPNWFEFDAQQGVERLWLVFSEDAVPELENVRVFASKQAKGVIADMTQNKVIQDFLTTHSATKPELEKGDTLTTLRMPGKLLLYPVRLEHH